MQYYSQNRIVSSAATVACSESCEMHEELLAVKKIDRKKKHTSSSLAFTFFSYRLATNFPFLYRFFPSGDS